MKQKFDDATITGQCYACQEKSHKINQFPNKEAKNQEGLARTLTGIALTVDTKDTRLLDESHTCKRLKILTMQFQEISERLNMCCVLWKMN